MRFSDIGKSFGAQAICPEREGSMNFIIITFLKMISLGN